MAKLNMALVKEQLAAAKRTVKKNTSNQNSRMKELIWKPDEGENLIRIVPNQFQEGTPFIKLTFHYQFTANINGEEKNVTYISPSNFGKPDPVIELSERLQKSGDRKLWGQGKQLEPKARTYVPIVVRGKEEEGVKFWGFGVQIFDQLVIAMDEPDYSEMIDLNNGNDIKVEFIPAEKSNKISPDGRRFPDTKIFIKPKSRPVIPADHPKAKEILEKITTQQPKLIEAWTCPEYDVLSKALEAFLKKREAGKAASMGLPVVAVETETVVVPTEEQIVSAPSESPSAAQAAANIAKPESTGDMKDVYDELFGLTK
jgi:hypothetical protein